MAFPVAVVSISAKSCGDDAGLRCHLVREKEDNSTRGLVLRLHATLRVVLEVFGMRFVKMALCVAAVLVVVDFAVPQFASAGIVSLTQATTCPTKNGSGGNWCQAGGTPFDLSSFTTLNLTTTGSAGFFVITNNTGATVTSMSVIFSGMLPANAVLTCGGGGTGIQGSGPKPMSGKASCSVNGKSKAGPGGTGSTLVAFTADYDWSNIDWASGAVFDLQIASFSNHATGTFSTPPTPPTPTPEPSSLLLLGSGLLGLGIVIRRRGSDRIQSPK